MCNVVTCVHINHCWGLNMALMIIIALCYLVTSVWSHPITGSHIGHSTMMKLIVIGALWSLIGNFSRKKRKERDTVTVSAASYDHKSVYVFRLRPQHLRPYSRKKALTVIILLFWKWNFAYSRTVGPQELLAIEKALQSKLTVMTTI